MDKKITTDKKTGRRRKRTRKYDGSMRAGMAQISGLRNELGVTDACAECAESLFERVVSSGLLAGRNVSRYAAASVLLACRKYEANRTIDDVARAAGMERRDIYRTYRHLLGQFDPDLPVQDPASFITRIGDAARISEEARRKAREILASAGGAETVGKDPVGLAAGALYVACVTLGETVMRRDIAEASGVAASTLSIRYGDLARVAGVRGTRFR